MIYLDNSATTRPCAEAVEAIRRLLCETLDRGKVCAFIRAGAEMRQREGHSRQPLHTSTHAL